MGIWDTVKAYGWIRPKSFPALRHNPSVSAVRHAVALDERRALFQMTGWGDRHGQVKEVWFAGDHSDVGGGHPCNSPLADAVLTWMLGEATQAGLLIDPAQWKTVDSIAESGKLAPTTKPNSLMKGGFRIPFPTVELNNSGYPPKRDLGIWPVGIRRPAVHAEPIGDDEHSPLLFHDSVRRRQQDDPRYRIENLLAGKRRVRNVDPKKLKVQYVEGA